MYRLDSPKPICSYGPYLYYSSEQKFLYLFLSSMYFSQCSEQNRATLKIRVKNIWPHHVIIHVIHRLWGGGYSAMKHLFGHSNMPRMSRMSHLDDALSLQIQQPIFVWCIVFQYLSVVLWLCQSISALPSPFGVCAGTHAFMDIGHYYLICCCCQTICSFLTLILF
jgi:hypothetical protein